MKPNLEGKLIDFIVMNKNRFYLLAYSYTHHEQNALDIVQDSIHKALIHVDSLQGEAQMKSWFYTILVRTAIDFLRKHNRVLLVGDEVLQQLPEHDTYENLD